MTDNTRPPTGAAQAMQTPSIRRVLIADDDEDIREALRVVLEDEGYVIQLAADGVQTLDVLTQSAPVVALLDVIMPHMSGFEVLSRVLQDDDLRARHAYIVLTAERTPYTRIGPRFSQLVEQHQIPILPKPFDLDELLNVIAQQAQRLAPVAGNPTWRG